MPPQYMTPPPGGPSSQGGHISNSSHQAYPTYDYEAEEPIHAQPNEPYSDQRSSPDTATTIPYGQQATYTSTPNHWQTDPFHPSHPVARYSPQQASSNNHNHDNHGVTMSQSHDQYQYILKEALDTGDQPLLPNNGSQYHYAPASAFTPDGHLVPGAGGVSLWPNAHRVDDGNDVTGMARWKMDMEDAGLASDEDVPGRWAPSVHQAEGGLGGIRYGSIPQRVPRRYKTIKRVELYYGNLVLDCPIPSRLLNRLNDRESREFTHMRYTAATCDPDNFKNERYTLRQVLFDPPRRTELFIVLTMYNEDEELFCRTLHGVMTNIAHLCTRERSKTWGKDGWKKVVVCIVSDGRAKINARVLSVLASMGVYQEGVGKNVVNGKPVTAHIYEYTTQISVDPDLKFRGQEKGIMPVQILFCLKERNQKKINSHRWFFNAFGRVLQPNVCVLLDIGTMPRARSIYHLWKAFDINSNVAGACGEIVALKGKLWSGLLNPLVAAQNFEYKMSNILDKPLESVFGYITVLPGAFSAYRYIALQNDALGQGPLASYFKGETLHGGSSDADIFTSNMYLADDRILCWELCSKRDCAWILHYVKSAQAVTDVPDAVPELISQRRRWLNGSFFAGIHSIVKFRYIYRSSHSVGRKFALHIELIYQFIALIFSWFGLANFFIAFYIFSRAFADAIRPMKIPGLVLSYVYAALIVFNFLLAMGNRPAGTRWAYIVSMCIFALLTLYMTAAAVYLGVSSITKATSSGEGASELLTDRTFLNVIVSLAATYGVWLVSSILFFEPWHMFTSVIQYLLMAPSFVNIISIYAFANIHDVSWGTKGAGEVATDLGIVARAGENKNQVEVAIPTEAKDIDQNYEDAVHMLSTRPLKEEKRVDLDQKQKDYYATVRTNVVTAWAISNASLSVAILNIGSASVRFTYMGFLLYSLAALSAFRMMGSIIYLVKRLFAGE